MNKLNIGCGGEIKKGYINLDIQKLRGVNIIHNLNKYPYPFKKNQFIEIYCNNILEHLDDIIKPMEELHRISMNGGKIIIEVPIYPSIWAMSDPTHKSFYTFFTFDYLREEDYLNYCSKARFIITKRRILFGYPMPFLTHIINCSEIIQKIYAHYFSMLIPADRLSVELETIK